MPKDTQVTRIEDILARKGYRRTHARHAIIAMFVVTQHALSLQDITSQAINLGINRSSVYRGIDVLEKEGVIVASVTRGVRYFELAQPHSPHHHHLTCSVCGRVISVHSPKLESVIKLIAEKHDFEASAHTFEITGVCNDCAPSKS